MCSERPGHQQDDHLQEERGGQAEAPREEGRETGPEAGQERGTADTSTTSTTTGLLP